MAARSRIAIWLTGCALVLALAAGPGAGVADESDHEQARQVLQPGGSLVKLKIDARDGTVLGMKGRDIQFRNRH